VNIPRNVRGAQQLCITAYGNESSATFCPSFQVMPGLLSSDVSKDPANGLAGESTTIPVLVKVNSIGETDVAIACGWKKQYCEQETTHIGVEKAKQVDFKVRYLFPGDYTVPITVTDMGSGDQVKLEAHVRFIPNVKNDMSTMHWGIPVSAPVLQQILALLSLVVGQ
jgi:hypothetical protein